MTTYPIPDDLRESYDKAIEVIKCQERQNLDPLEFPLVGMSVAWANSHNKLVERIAKLEAVLLSAGFSKSADEKSWVPPLNVVATKLYKEKFAIEAAVQCGKPAKMLGPFSWFSCVLPPSHEGECRMGGNCFAHGSYVGDQCPLWPACVEKQVEGMKFATGSKVAKLEAENASLREQLRVMQELVSDEEWLGLCSGDHVQFTDMQRSDLDSWIAARTQKAGA